MKTRFLPKNWADQLPVDAAQSILVYWQGRVPYWQWFLAMDDPIAEQFLANAKSRVILWQQCLDRKRNGQRCQDLVNEAREADRVTFGH